MPKKAPAPKPKTVKLHQDPNFGRDPWIGPGIPGAFQPQSVTDFAAPLFSAADALTGDIVLLPEGLNAYMSYIDNFGGWGELVARFGKSKAFLVSITIFGGRARCADVEPGAMSAGDLPRWLDSVALHDQTSPPWVYTNAANMAECNDAIGGREAVRWSAHVGHGPHVCGPNTCGYPQADWTQWVFSGAEGQNIDRSVGFWLPTSHRPVDHHYDRYDSKRRVVYGRGTERQRVKEYDRLRALQTTTEHPHRARLRVLRGMCRAGAVRIKVLGRPALFHRKWRRTKLLERAKGAKVA